MRLVRLQDAGEIANAEYTKVMLQSSNAKGNASHLEAKQSCYTFLILVLLREWNAAGFGFVSLGN
jgi:hypothetical protein